MAIFEDIELEWEGVPYRLKGDGDIMRAIAAVEDHVTVGELVEASKSGRMPLGKLSCAFAAVLRQAGARVTDAEVYAGMWKDGGSVPMIIDAVQHLLAMMMPPSVMQDAAAETEAAAGEKHAKKKPKSGSRSKPTKSQS